LMAGRVGGWVGDEQRQHPSMAFVEPIHGVH
jgi:hypothetical protein